MIDKQFKIAIVYDWVTTEYGGAEKILTALHQLFPQAPLFTLISSNPLPNWCRGWNIHSSFLNTFPLASKKYRTLAPLMPLATESLNLSSYEIIISVSSSFSKGVITLPKQLHICYLLTPPRFLYSHPQDYPTSNFFFSPLMNYLKFWDQLSVIRPDVIIPISNLVASRFRTAYGFNTEKVIYPPVPTLNITNNQSDNSKKAFPGFENYLLVVSRLVKYKKVDLAIKASQFLDLNLIIVGNGPEEETLKRIASTGKKNRKIKFYSDLKENDLAQLYKNATAVIQPNIEDFGIAVLEGQLLGTPSILCKSSGATELLTEDQASFFDKPTVNNIVSAIKTHFQKEFNTRNLINNMKKYDTTSFIKKFERVVDHHWSQHQNRY